MEIKKVTVTLNVNGKVLHLVLGHTYAEWKKNYGGSDDIWDFPLEELVDGTIEPNEDIWYWYIGDRVYETNENVK